MKTYIWLPHAQCSRPFCFRWCSAVTALRRCFGAPHAAPWQPLLRVNHWEVLSIKFPHTLWQSLWRFLLLQHAITVLLETFCLKLLFFVFPCFFVCYISPRSLSIILHIPSYVININTCGHATCHKSLWRLTSHVKYSATCCSEQRMQICSTCCLRCWPNRYAI